VIYLFRDLNNDGDALDEGESRVVAGAGNAAGVSFAFPTGAAFDDLGRLYIVNASNSFGDDAVYRLVDLNADGDFMDVDEITVYVGPGAFGGTRTNFSPQEIFFAGSTMYLRNSNGSSPSQFGIYRALDANNDGDADDPGEFTYFGHTATSGIAATSGFATEPDRFHEGSVYTLQLATGGVDQLVRLTDLNTDGDALDPGEALLVYSTAESGFTSIDILSLPTGEVYITDNSTKRIIVLRDLNADGDFFDDGERSTLFAAMGGVVGDIRQIVHFTACKADVTGDDGVTIDDLLLYLATFEAGGFCADLDDGSGTGTPDGGVTIDDLLYYLQRFEAGC
jgi:WD40 repeat protein